jgi:uncharacterized protein YbjT (DUF2867 family)
LSVFESAETIGENFKESGESLSLFNKKKGKTIMKNILITGATGNVGSQLVKNLENKNLNLSVMLRKEDNDKVKNFEENEITVKIGDFADKDSLRNALEEVDVAYLLVPGVPKMMEMSRNFIEIAKETGVKRIVKQSVLGANPDAPVEILKLHGLIDNELKDSGIAYTIIQPNGFMQNFIGSADSIKTQNALYLNFGDGKYSAVDVRDIAASTAAAINGDGHENKTYTITGPEAIGGQDFTDALSRALGRTINYVAISDTDAKNAMLNLGMDEWLVDNFVGFGRIFANNWASEVSEDVFKLTGKNPATIEQFANDFADYFKN